jgi:hypothetical protein
MMSASAAENLPNLSTASITPPWLLPPQVTYSQPFWLTVGQSAVVKNTNFKLTFNGVSPVSQCPSGVQCLIGGIIPVTNLTFFQGKKQYPIKLIPFSTQSSKTIDKLVNITLLETDQYLNFYSPWLTSLINKLSAAPVANPPAQIIQYQYHGATVYYLPERCCDIPSFLYDMDGNFLCSPDGGITGGGDFQCPDFISTKTQELVIWRDKRGKFSSEISPQAYVAKLVITPYSKNSCGNDLAIAAQLIEPYDLYESINDMLAVEYLVSDEWPSDNDLSEVITPPTGTYTKGFTMNAAKLYVEATMRSKANGVLPCLADKSIRFYYHPNLDDWTCSVNIPNGVPSEYMTLFPMTCN